MHNMSPSLDTMQFGNRKRRPTTHYLADLVHLVLSDVELGRYINLLMIDYSKAFDKVDITVALEKLLYIHRNHPTMRGISSNSVVNCFGDTDGIVLADSKLEETASEF